MNSKMTARSLPAFDWEDFYHLADEWQVAHDSYPDRREARLRCIISRAYYGVWNLCREHAEREAVNRPLPASGNSHDDIIQWFYRGSDETHKGIASNLDRLRTSRVTADYKKDWKKATPQGTAANALFYANRILNGLSMLDV